MSGWKKIGSLRKSQKGSNYLKIDMDITLKKGDVVQLTNPRESLDKAVEAGRMSAEKAQEIKEKIPDYIRFELTLAPSKNT